MIAMIVPLSLFIDFTPYQPSEAYAAEITQRAITGCVITNFGSAPSREFLDDHFASKGFTLDITCGADGSVVVIVEPFKKNDP